ncbi:MAG: MATE family efflux transporter [Synergistaceae bacterium]|jgi:putative MATE family efflux protein|nr:MATE family efflux transporter [Synergistaceae bacterium]
MPENSDVASHPLATGSVGKLLLKFAIPSIVSMLVGALYNIVDQVFIGRGVGMLGNAATNVAFPLMTISMATTLTLAIGGASNFNLALGRGDKERAGRVIANAIMYSAIFGTIIGAAALLLLEPMLVAFGATDDVLPYALTYTGITSLGAPFIVMSVCGSHLIRADGSPKYAMLCNLSGAVLNTILDPIFIFVFDMGIAGAAWATVISIIASWLMVMAHLINFRSVKLKANYFRPSLSVLRSITALGMAVGFNQLSMMFVQVALNNILTFYGASSVYGSNIPLAASGIITKVNLIFMAVVVGFAQGGQPIIGFNYGARKYARVRRTFRFTLSSATCVSVVVFAVFQIFPREIIDLFGKVNDQYYQFVERYFRIFLFMTFVNGIQPVTANFFSSIGKGMRGFFISLTRQILFLLPLIIIFPRYWGIDGVMYAGPLADFAAACLAAFFIVREIREMKELERAESR